MHVFVFCACVSERAGGKQLRYNGNILQKSILIRFFTEKFCIFLLLVIVFAGNGEGT